MLQHAHSAGATYANFARIAMELYRPCRGFLTSCTLNTCRRQKLRLGRAHDCGCGGHYTLLCNDSIHAADAATERHMQKECSVSIYVLQQCPSDLSFVDKRTRVRRSNRQSEPLVLQAASLDGAQATPLSLTVPQFRFVPDPRELPFCLPRSARLSRKCQ